MKLSLNWLKDYVATGVSPEKLAHKLTMAGFEVEKISSIKGDIIFELEITPNRPDCLNMLGISREVAAILNKTCARKRITKRTRPKQKCNIEISDKKACSRYVGTLIENIVVKKTQENIIKRLTAVGIRSINNVVDITNFCLMETGQPLHAFDYDQINGGKIIVRRARKGEKIVTIDDVERKLDPSILVIADAKRPIAIAGIMGGKDAEVTSATKNILLESAYFDPVLIRRSSRKLGLISDSSYRFERGVDYTAVTTGANRATDLILRYAKGTITKYADKASGKYKNNKRKIVISRKWVNNYVGTSITAARFKNILVMLGFQVARGQKDSFKISVPSFRNDVAQAVDIVEEISRIVGYDNLESSAPQIKIVHGLSDTKVGAKHAVRNLLLAQGLNEAITYTMINREMLGQSNQASVPSIGIFNPLTQDQEIMRPSMLPSLLSIVRSNINRGQRDLKIFEIGKIYLAKEEIDALGIIMTGLRASQWRRTDDLSQGEKNEVTYYDPKGIIEQVLLRRGIKEKNVKFVPAQEPYYENGQSALILINGKQVGSVGRIEDHVLAKWDIKQENVYFAQVELRSLYESGLTAVKYKPVSELPVINRDISLAVSSNVTADDIKGSIRQTARNDKSVELTNIKFLELHAGKKIPDGHRGLIFSLTYQSRHLKTLRDDEVELVHSRVCDRLVEDLGVIRR